MEQVFEGTWKETDAFCYRGNRESPRPPQPIRSLAFAHPSHDVSPRFIGIHRGTARATARRLIDPK